MELQLQEALFRSSTEKLFVNVDIHIIEQRVLLVGNVSSQELRDQAARIAWEISPKIKDVLNEIDLPLPVPQAGEVLVQLVYSGVNPSDVKARAGLRPGVSKPAYDLIVPHSDGSGVITAVGAGGDAARIG